MSHSTLQARKFLGLVTAALCVILATPARADEGLGGGFNSVTDIVEMANRVAAAAAAGDASAGPVAAENPDAAAGIALLRKLGEESMDGSSG
jgi:hypothetical protein